MFPLFFIGCSYISLFPRQEQLKLVGSDVSNSRVANGIEESACPTMGSQ